MDGFFAERVAPVLVIVCFVGGTIVCIHEWQGPAEATTAEATPPAPPMFTYTEQRDRTSNILGAAGILTDTTTGRQYIVVLTGNGIAVVPRLPAEDAK